MILEQGRTETKQLAVLVNEAPPRQATKDLENDDRILAAIGQYDSLPLIRYLDLIMDLN